MNSDIVFAKRPSKYVKRINNKEGNFLLLSCVCNKENSAG